MCEMCDIVNQAKAGRGGQAYVLDSHDHVSARRAANEVWQLAAAEVAPVLRELMREVSLRTIAATKSGDKVSAAIGSLASTALIELLARKLEREAVQATAVTN